MDKEKAKKDMIQALKDAEEYLDIYGNCVDHEHTAENLINAGYGNINQAITEFAERLYKKAEDRMDCHYGMCMTVTVDDIQETLKEMTEK